jgi:anion-transporting  ArsA/GET3 family ATPase
MGDLFDKRFVINTGKGGVGKTTLSAAIGLAAARRGKRVLVMELNAKDKLARLFGASSVGDEPIEIEENLFAINVTPDAALEEYLLLKLRLKTLYRAVFENRFVRSFLRVIPGLNELVLLGKAWHEENRRDPDTGRPVWDMVVIDAPATGHGVFFLKIPDVIISALRAGPMVDEARRIADLLHDPRRTALNLITLVEEMPVNETIELRQQLRAELKVPLGFVIANAIYPPLFSDEQADQLRALREKIPNNGDHLDRMMEAALFRRGRVELQREYLDRIDREVDLPQLHVPYYFTERFDFQTISRIADQLDRQVRAHLQGRWEAATAMYDQEPG